MADRVMRAPYIVTISGKAENGKDTLANILTSLCKQCGYKSCVIHYADLLKYIASQYFGWDGKKDKKGRHILQYIGTDLVRKQRENFWVEMLDAIVTTILRDYDVIFIADTRFPNEIEYWRGNRLLASIKVERLGYENHLTDEQKDHPSETALDDYGFDYIVQAVTIEELQENAGALFEDLFIF